jgi:hypothetical protein
MTLVTGNAGRLSDACSAERSVTWVWEGAGHCLDRVWYVTRRAQELGRTMVPGSKDVGLLGCYWLARTWVVGSILCAFVCGGWKDNQPSLLLDSIFLYICGICLNYHGDVY